MPLDVEKLARRLAAIELKSENLYPPVRGAGFEEYGLKYNALLEERTKIIIDDILSYES